MRIITRNQAKDNGGKHYFTGTPCKSGHISNRYVSSRQCVECESNVSQERKRQYHRAYRHRNEESVLRKSREYKHSHRDLMNRISREWYRKNPHIGSSRREGLQRATPKWADLDAIEQIYQERILLEQETGIKHNVDHYYPIHGTDVCGLHVVNNLKIITKKENQQKQNTHPDIFYNKKPAEAG